MSEKFLKLTPWVPLLIAAGYFIFLIATWQKFTVNLKAADERFNQMLSKLSPNTIIPPEAPAI